MYKTKSAHVAATSLSPSIIHLNLISCLSCKLPVSGEKPLSETASIAFSALLTGSGGSEDLHGESLLPNLASREKLSQPINLAFVPDGLSSGLCFSLCCLCKK